MFLPAVKKRQARRMDEFRHNYNVVLWWSNFTLSKHDFLIHLEKQLERLVESVF
jgi:hypothetical protein